MLKDKVVLITGAAMGMGEAHARLCAARGASVILTDLDEHGALVAAELGAMGANAHFRPLDVTDRSAWKACVGWSIKQFGRIDGLVNNAGILIRKPTPEITDADWDALFNINVKGTFLGCQEVLPAMRMAKTGSIINISSISGYVANMAGMSAYCATKGAIRLMTKGIAVDYAEYGIRCNSIHPGTISTNMTRAMEATPESLKVLLGVTVLQRLGQPVEVSEGVCFLLSDASSYMTGSEMTIDGGFTAV